MDFNILLDKLNHYGFRGKTHDWFVSYLSDRKQHTIFNDSLSDPRDIIMGVPQGSVLGPILFILFINGIYKSSDFFHLLFADDTTLQLSSKNFMI